MPVADGLRATREIAADERPARVQILILTVFGSDEYVFEALRAGAGGFLLEDARDVSDEPYVLFEASERRG